MFEEDAQDMLRNDPDYITLRRYEFSLALLKQKYGDDPIPNKLIASALDLTEEELEDEYARIVKKLRHIMVLESGNS